VADRQAIIERAEAFVHQLQCDLSLLDIPRSRQNPKILWVDDAEVVGASANLPSGESSLKIASIVSLNAPPTWTCSNHRVMSAIAILLW